MADCSLPLMATVFFYLVRVTVSKVISMSRVAMATIGRVRLNRARGVRGDLVSIRTLTAWKAVPASASLPTDPMV